MVLADVSMVLADVSLLLERCIVARDKIVNGGYIQSKHTPFSPAPSNIQVIIEITLYSLHNYLCECEIRPHLTKNNRKRLNTKYEG